MLSSLDRRSNFAKKTLRRRRQKFNDVERLESTILRWLASVRRRVSVVFARVSFSVHLLFRVSPISCLLLLQQLYDSVIVGVSVITNNKSILTQRCKCNSVQRETNYTYVPVFAST